MEPFVRKKILVVDDDPQVATSLARRLSHAGFEVLSTRSGRGAIHCAQCQHPALMTLDVRLPDMDGLEVAMRLSHDAQTAAIPIIFITGTADRHLKENFDSNDDHYFIRKPYDPDLLIRLINSLLARDELGEMRRVSKAKRRQPVSAGSGQVLSPSGSSSTDSKFPS